MSRSHTKVRAIILNAVAEARAELVKKQVEGGAITNRKYNDACDAFNTLTQNEEVLASFVDALRKMWH